MFQVFHVDVANFDVVMLHMFVCMLQARYLDVAMLHMVYVYVAGVLSGCCIF